MRGEVIGGDYVSQRMSVAKQNEAIKQEIERLTTYFGELPPEKVRVAIPLIERVAFMTITLQLLEEEVKAKGPVVTFKNGSQKMTIENPAQKSYNTMVNRYTAAYAKLVEMLPKPTGKPSAEGDDFNEFVAGRD